jgi:hypothetical protein
MIKNQLFLLTLILTSFMANSQLIIEAPLPEEPKVIAFASDTQAPMWVETILLKSHNNRKATTMVFNEILKSQPSSLFLLGDVVNLGYSKRQWKPIDKHINELRENNIEVHAILGNHEIMGRPRTGELMFQQRFPNHNRTGFVEIVDSVAVVLLNSNFSTLSKAEDEAQIAWYKETLNKLDNDESVKFIIAGTHHSPFTNSKIVKPSKPVHDKFVPDFIASEKGKLFLSGHCHGFEHYNIKGKDFMVIGGGGGLNQPLRQGVDALPDLATDYKPLFHYLTVRRLDDRLEVTSHKLNANFTAFEEGRRHDIIHTMKTEAIIASAE